MQYLVLLLLIIGVVVIMIAFFFGISYAIGRFFYDQDNPQADASAGPCAQCDADRGWYDSLPAGKRTAATGWWVVNRYACTAKGCK